jgi:hypothetical protein
MASVEERLAKVEKEIADLKARTDSHSPKPGWLRRVEGSFKDDPDFLEITQLGKEARDEEKLQD